MTTRVIQTDALRKRFGPKVAVEDLTLSIEGGEVFGFLGPNGAGKTTSLKLLLGLIEPTAGSGRVLGEPLGHRAARAGIGFLPEHFQFHNALTGRELLRIHGQLYGLRGRPLDERVKSLLERVSLTDAADRRVGTYSKGMVQRTGIAQALINDPELVFLDEPTSGLDPLGRMLVRELIDELRNRGATVFLNSHLLGEVEATCDRVAFVKHGRVIQQLKLADQPDWIDVEVRLGEGSMVPQGIEAYGTEARCEGDRLTLRVPSEDTLPKLAAWLVGRGLALYELKPRRKTLEQWFVDVMGDDQRPG